MVFGRTFFILTLRMLSTNFSRRTLSTAESSSRIVALNRRACETVTKHRDEARGERAKASHVRRRHGSKRSEISQRWRTCRLCGDASCQARMLTPGEIVKESCWCISVSSLHSLQSIIYSNRISASIEDRFKDVSPASSGFSLPSG